MPIVVPVRFQATIPFATVSEARRPSLLATVANIA